MTTPAPETAMTPLDILRRARTMPVLTIANVDDAVPLAEALAEGGLTVLEITLRTPAALDAIAAIARALPRVLVGAGTLLSPADLARAAQAGARFALSPGATPALLAAATASPLPFIPGVATASETMAARDAGFTALKFFPAEQLGGSRALASLGAPLSDLMFCPTGGVTPENAPAYRALANVACVGGSWMAMPALVAARDWAKITELARATLA